MFVLSASAAKWERFGDSMYTFKLDIAREVDTTHVDASFQCQSVGGWLVSIESTAEQEFIQKKIREKVEDQGQNLCKRTMVGRVVTGTKKTKNGLGITLLKVG